MEVLYDHLFASILAILHLKYLVPLVLGTIAGVIGGALPGITITMTIIMVLPFTFGLDPLQGLAAMTGVYVGGSAGGCGLNRSASWSPKPLRCGSSSVGSFSSRAATERRRSGSGANSRASRP